MLHDTLRGDLHILLAAELMGPRPSAVSLADQCLSLLRSHDLEALLSEESNDDLPELLLDLFATDDLDDADAHTLEALGSAFDAWLARIDVGWDASVPVERPLPDALVTACEDALQELAESSDGEHAPEPSRAALRDAATSLVEACGGPPSPAEQGAVEWLLAACIAEVWDPWPEEVDGRLVAAVLTRRWARRLGASEPPARTRRASGLAAASRRKR